jgi:hypothetical protein
MHAAIHLEVAGVVRARIARPTLVFFLGALLAHAMDAVRSVPARTARILTTASAYDDAVLIEISHNGRAIPTDLRPSLLDAYLALPGHRAANELSIEGLQRRVRSLGGELLVMTDDEATMLRLVLPASEEAIEEAFDVDEPVSTRMPHGQKASR